MNEFSDFYKRFFKSSPKEKELEDKIERLSEEYEKSDAYLAYKKSMDKLFEELSKERTQNRVDIGQKPKINTLKTLKKNRETVDYSEAEKVVKMYNSLNEQNKRYFLKHTDGYNGDLEEYENPITTNEQLGELQEILVQVCINYIKENKLSDIDEICFNVDSLQESVRLGEWIPATDSYIRAVGISSENNNDTDFYTRKKIGEIW